MEIKEIIDFSNKYTETTDKIKLKKTGKYFTTDSILIDILTKDCCINTNNRILEPSSGSGILVAKLLSINKNINIESNEIDKFLYDC